MFFTTFAQIRRQKMNYPSVTDVLYADACLLLMTTSVICAIVRWAHMCRPYGEDGDYFYPARKQLTFFYAGVVLQFPYFLSPADEGVWCYIRLLGMVYYPMCLSLLYSRYFHGRRLAGLKRGLFFGLPMLVPAALLLLLSMGKGPWIASQYGWMQYAVCGLSVAMTCQLAQVMNAIYRSIREFHLQNYSAEEDFPYRFAGKMLSLPLIWIVMVWCIFVTGSRELKLVIDVVMSAWSVAVLCMVLHPQRLGRPAEQEEQIQLIEEEEQLHADECTDAGLGSTEVHENGNNNVTPTAADTDNDEVVQAVLAVIVRKYKDQHLLKSEVLAEIDKGMMAPASRFMARVGYYNLINMFRLRHAQLYIEAHPDTKLSEVALLSGFLSASAFSKAKKNIKHIHPEYVAGVKL